MVALFSFFSWPNFVTVSFPLHVGGLCDFGLPPVEVGRLVRVTFAYRAVARVSVRIRGRRDR